MAIYGESLTIQYVAWDTTNNAPKTGDASNHTLRWVKDGTAAAPTNSPSEVDATNAPGVYKLTLTASETQCWVGTLCGKSSTSGVVIMPVTLTFERLPTAAPGSSGGLPVIGSAPLTNLDAAISSRSTLTAADVWSYANRQLSAFSFNVTVGGYASGQSPSEHLQAVGYTSTRAARLDNLDVSVSSRLAATAYTAPDNVGIAAIKAKTDQLTFAGTDVKATLDGEQVIVATNLDKTGYRLTADYDRAKTALAVSEYTAPDNAGIAAIKSQTDKLTFDANNYVYAVATVDVDEQAIADAVAAQISGVTVVVQPLHAMLQRVDGDGGTLTAWTYAKFIASWIIENVNLTGHDLRLLVFNAAAPDQAVAEYSTAAGEIAVTFQDPNSIIMVNGADAKTPAAGAYRFVLRDQTIDAVLLSGQLVVLPAPDASA